MKDFIFHNLKESVGSEESAKLYLCINVNKGTVEAVLTKSVTQRFPVQELEAAKDLYERLTCGSGRRVFKPEDLAHPYNPNN